MVLNVICSLSLGFIRNRFLCTAAAERRYRSAGTGNVVLLLYVLTRDNDERFRTNLLTVNSRQPQPPWTTHDAFEAGVDSMPNVRADVSVADRHIRARLLCKYEGFSAEQFFDKM